jgi:hypothetical protein
VCENYVNPLDEMMLISTKVISYHLSENKAEEKVHSLIKGDNRMNGYINTPVYFYYERDLED